MEGSERKHFSPKKSLTKLKQYYFYRHNFPIAQMKRERHWYERKNSGNFCIYFIYLIHFEANSWHFPCSLLHFLLLLSPCLCLSQSPRISLCFSKPYSILVSISRSLPFAACLQDTAVQHTTLESDILTQGLNPN